MTARLIVFLSCKVNKYLSKFRWSQLYCQLKLAVEKFSNEEIMFITAVVYKLEVLHHFARLGSIRTFLAKK